MAITGADALRIWGLVHQYRLPDSPEEQKKSNKARREHACARLARERDGLIEAYAKLGRDGKLTPAAAARVKAIKDGYAKRIKAEHRAGFAIVHEALQTQEPYPRRTGSDHPNMNPDCFVADVFLVVDAYLNRRPMQRALAWHKFVIRGTIRDFRHEHCRSSRGATRAMTNLRARLDRLFDENVSH